LPFDTCDDIIVAEDDPISSANANGHSVADLRRAWECLGSSCRRRQLSNGVRRAANWRTALIATMLMLFVWPCGGQAMDRTTAVQLARDYLASDDGDDREELSE